MKVTLFIPTCLKQFPEQWQDLLWEEDPEWITGTIVHRAMLTGVPFEDVDMMGVNLVTHSPDLMRVE